MRFTFRVVSGLQTCDFTAREASTRRSARLPRQSVQGLGFSVYGLGFFSEADDRLQAYCTFLWRSGLVVITP